jgi:hypothetical protein
VDFWSLDVEGAELFVLQGMDFSAVEVGMVMVEISETKEMAAKVEAVFIEEGFVRDETFHSWNNLNALYLNTRGEWGGAAAPGSWSWES